MERFDHIIIGTGIAGTTAAETIRAKDPSATIALIGDEPHRLYSRVMLPKVVRGKVQENQAFLRTEEAYAAKQISFFPGAGVAAVAPETHTVRLANGTELTYDKALLIASGGTPRRLDVSGAETIDTMYFQTLEDSRRLAGTAARSAVVYGGGFIALEFLLSFVHLGIPTMVIMRGEGFFSRVLDLGSRERIASACAGHGVTLRYNTTITNVALVQGMKEIRLSSGDTLHCDALGVGIGLTPNVRFLEGSGVAVRDGVITDSALRTGTPDVFAAGDVAEHLDTWTGEHRIVGNWQNAMFQGKVAGANMVGGEELYGMLTAYSIDCFGLPIAFLGAAELPEAERVVRESADTSLQLVIKNNRIVGATCVGPFSERAALTKLISDRVEMTDRLRTVLGDHRTPLASLIP